MPASSEEVSLALERITGVPEQTKLFDNYINETIDGYGMVIDSSTCKLEQNVVKKNNFGGLLVTSTLQP